MSEGHRSQSEELPMAKAEIIQAIKQIIWYWVIAQNIK